MKNKKAEFVVSGFINKDNKYLLVFDPKFDFWRVPGGRSKFGEKVEDTLKREMKEELNIKIKVTNFLGFGQDVVTLVKKEIEAYRLLLYFECEIKGGELEPRTPNEISEVKWLTLDEIKNHPNLEPGMQDLFGRFYYK